MRRTFPFYVNFILRLSDAEVKSQCEDREDKKHYEGGNVASRICKKRT